MADLAIHSPLRPLTPTQRPKPHRGSTRDSEVVRQMDAAQEQQSRLDAAQAEAQARADRNQQRQKLPKTVMGRILQPLKACLCPPRRQ